MTHRLRVSTKLSSAVPYCGSRLLLRPHQASESRVQRSMPKWADGLHCARLSSEVFAQASTSRTLATLQEIGSKAGDGNTTVASMVNNAANTRWQRTSRPTNRSSQDTFVINVSRRSCSNFGLHWPPLHFSLVPCLRQVSRARTCCSVLKLNRIKRIIDISIILKNFQRKSINCSISAPMKKFVGIVKPGLQG